MVWKNNHFLKHLLKIDKFLKRYTVMNVDGCRKITLQALKPSQNFSQRFFVFMAGRLEKTLEIKVIFLPQ